jgi:FAD/FMN-containing dehydrogenase
MVNERFIQIIKNEFPEDRLTYQASVPTFHPEDVAEAASLFKFAGEHKAKLFIAGFGNNISPVGDKFGDIVAVKSDRLNKFIKVVPQDFYAVVGGGYPIAELNRRLAEDNLFLPHSDLAYAGSVGGALAIGLSAIKDSHLLPISRYFILGEIATPDGRVIRPGSGCFKSVSGFDIIKIFSPSWGLLGMIVSVTLRVLPMTIRDDFEGMVMQSIDFRSFAGIYKNPGDNQSAIYSIKIKEKFDPNGILPLIA